MHRMLIVDDEEIITDGLMEIFGGLDLELDLYKAYSGDEALQLLQRTRVDLVLSDICMPEMDGLELMGHIHQRWPQCKIVFLTGHDEFDYVYRAIQQPDVQYVLKSEGYPKLIEAVRRALRELDDALRVGDLVRQSQERLNKLETLAQGDYFRELLHHAKTVEELREDFKELRIPLDPAQPVLLALGNLAAVGPRQSYAGRQETALAAKYLAESFLMERTVSSCVIDRYGDLIWLIQPHWRIPLDEPGRYEQTLMFLEGTFERIELACYESLQLTTALTLGREALGWEAVPAAYDELRHRQHFRVGDGAQMVQTVSLRAESAAPVRDRLLRDKSEALAAHLEAGRKAEFLELFGELTAPVLQEKGSPYVKELYYTIAVIVLSYINRLDLRERADAFNLMQPEAYRSWEEAFDYLKESASALFTDRRSGEQKRAASVIRKISAYLEAHLAEDLSLVRLADEFHFNPSYLSRLFKQERGVNLSEYIEALRIRKAKELLGREELKVAEVGALIGYDTPQSFTRFFKKMTSLSPQHYRSELVLPGQLEEGQV